MHRLPTRVHRTSDVEYPKIQNYACLGGKYVNKHDFIYKKK